MRHLLMISRGPGTTRRLVSAARSCVARARAAGRGGAQARQLPRGHGEAMGGLGGLGCQSRLRRLIDWVKKNHAQVPILDSGQYVSRWNAVVTWVVRE